MSKKHLAIIIPTTIAAVPATFGTCHFLNRSSTAPIISANTAAWTQKAIVNITEAATFGNSEIDYYEYCLSGAETTDNCAWRKTTSDSVSIITAGSNNVWFRGVSKNGITTDPSNVVHINVDRTKPNADSEISADESSINVALTASDDLSGIASYAYSLDGAEYVEGDINYSFLDLTPGTTYKIKVKITDNAGNIRYVSLSQSIASPVITAKSANASFAKLRNMPSFASFPGQGGDFPNIAIGAKSKRPSESAEPGKGGTIMPNPEPESMPEEVTEEIIANTITFELSDGTFDEGFTIPTEYEPGTIITLPEPTRDGFDFLGWSCTTISENLITNNELSIPADYSGELILIANWSAKTDTETPTTPSEETPTTPDESTTTPTEEPSTPTEETPVSTEEPVSTPVETNPETPKTEEEPTKVA